MSTRNRTAATIAAMTAACVTGCSSSQSSPDVVKPQVVVVDRSTHSLTSGSLLAIDGTYGAGCTQRSGAWSIAIQPGATLDNPALSVVRNNTGCVLTLTGLVADALYTGTPSIAMTDAYQTSASAFASGGGAVAFYANAKLDSLGFATDFVVTVLFSDNSSRATGGNTATATTSQSSATSQQVQAPNYTIDASSIAVATDNANIVQTATGLAQLTDGTATGEAYVVDLGTLPLSPTYAEVDAAYLAGTAVAITGADPSIDAASFDLVGLDLSTPQVRTVIVSHTESGVRSYELLVVTFNAFGP